MTNENENYNLQTDDIANTLIIIPKHTIDIFLKQDNAGDLIALYTFYYYTGKWQKTNSAYCTDGYVRKGLGWGYDRFRAAKNKLLHYGIIEQVKRNDEKGKITGWYIKLTYMFKRETIEDTVLPQLGLSTSGKNHAVDSSSAGKQTTNALSSGILNAYSSDNKREEQSLPNGYKLFCESWQKKTAMPVDTTLHVRMKSYFEKYSVPESIIQKCVSKNKTAAWALDDIANEMFKEKNGFPAKNTNAEFAAKYGI